MEILKCQNCGREFKFYQNSTIKPKLCLRCHNKSLLERSNLSCNSKSGFKTGKYTAKKGSGAKRTKTAKERFYSSAAWRWFSRYVLIKHSVDGKVVQCCTCKNYKRVNDRKMHVGHWIKVFNGNSSNYSVAFEYNNTGPQCLQCNKFMGGREIDMMDWIEFNHGEDEIKRLRSLSKQPFKLDDYTLKKIADEYREGFYGFLKEKGWDNAWKK
jgi:hypothetical protein